MTVTITITTETAAQASAEAAILAAGGLRQEHVQQAPAVTAPREATTFGPHLTFFGAERDALADALGVAPFDRTNPASYVDAAQLLRADLGTNEGDSAALAAIAKELGLATDAEGPAIVASFDALCDEGRALKREVKRLTDVLGAQAAGTDPAKRKPGRPKKEADAEAAAAVTLDPETLAMVARPRAIPKEGEPGQQDAAELAPIEDDIDPAELAAVANGVASTEVTAKVAAIMRGADRPLTPEQDTKLDAALLAARGPDHPMAAAAPLTPAWPAPDTVDWWIARVKNTIRTDVEFGDWDAANVATAARVLFGVPPTQTTIKNALAFKFGLHETQIATLLRSNDVWRNSVEIDTEAVVRALLKMWRPDTQADAQTLGFYVPPAAASNVTAAYNDDPRGDGIPF